MKKILATIGVIWFMLAWPGHAQAQARIKFTENVIPVDSVLDLTFRNVMMANATKLPSLDYWYAISHVSPNEAGNVVLSVTGIKNVGQNGNWYFMDAAWFGQVELWQDASGRYTGVLVPFSQNAFEISAEPEEIPAPPSATELLIQLVTPIAVPVAEAVGFTAPEETPENWYENGIIFPWQPGKTMYFGPNGFHSAGYNMSGWWSVDFLGGAGYSNTASPAVYAATSFTVVNICNDNTTVALITSDNFIYAHLLNNQNLYIGKTFRQGEFIGNLKYGTFDNNCGWASQAETTYHLHFGFMSPPIMEGYALDIFTNQEFVRGIEAVGIGDGLTATWINPGGQPGQGSPQNLFDWLLYGGQGIVLNVVDVFPERNNSTIQNTILTGALTTMGMIKVIAWDILSMKFPVSVVLLVVTIDAARALIAVWRMILKMIPMAG